MIKIRFVISDAFGSFDDNFSEDGERVNEGHVRKLSFLFLSDAVDLVVLFFISRKDDKRR